MIFCSEGAEEKQGIGRGRFVSRLDICVLWLNSSHQLSTTQPLACSFPVEWGRGSKGERENTWVELKAV